MSTLLSPFSSADITIWFPLEYLLRGYILAMSDMRCRCILFALLSRHSLPLNWLRITSKGHHSIHMCIDLQVQNNYTLYSSVRLKYQRSTFALASSEPETKSGGPFLRGQQLFTKFVCSLIFLTCSPVLVSQALTVMSGEAVITRSPSVVQCKSRIAFLCPAGNVLLNLTFSTWIQALPTFEVHSCPCCLLIVQL